jgi:uncharacterized membrane protein YeiB
VSAVAETVETLPVTPATRMDVLDVLRGVAIFGILILQHRCALGVRDGSAGGPGWRSGRSADQQSFIPHGVSRQGKFYCLFSFLFGAGFAFSSTAHPRAALTASGCSSDGSAGCF